MKCKSPLFQLIYLFSITRLSYVIQKFVLKLTRVSPEARLIDTCGRCWGWQLAIFFYS